MGLPCRPRMLRLLRGLCQLFMQLWDHSSISPALEWHPVWSHQDPELWRCSSQSSRAPLEAFCSLNLGSAEVRRARPWPGPLPRIEVGKLAEVRTSSAGPMAVPLGLEPAMVVLEKQAASCNYGWVPCHFYLAVAAEEACPIDLTASLNSSPGDPPDRPASPSDYYHRHNCFDLVANVAASCRPFSVVFWLERFEVLHSPAISEYHRASHLFEACSCLHIRLSSSGGFGSSLAVGSAPSGGCRHLQSLRESLAGLAVVL